MKFHILIYWCQMNYADSARIATILKNIWFEQTNKIEDAKIVIFDTCSVRQKSEDKITWKLKEIPKDKKIWITWCMVQHNLSLKKLKSNTKLYKKWTLKYNKWNFIWNLSEIKKDEIPFMINNVFSPIWSNLKKKFNNLELMFRIDDIQLLPKIVEYLWYKINKNEIQKISSYIELMPKVANQTQNEKLKTAYVPISTWCNQFCSYCIVPFARWLETYRNIKDIVDEVNYWTKQGKQEIVLLWQIVNKHPKFYEILVEVLKNKQVKWLRYTSPYPTYYNDDIFKLHETEQRLCPHIHMPIQSGSDKILKLMNRWYKVEQLKEFIYKIKTLKRNISITTDIIVWFSNETDDDFTKTLDIVNYWKFDMIYTWIYSPRPNTKAYKTLEDNISKKEKHKRWEILNNLLSQISLKNNKQEIWKIRKTMITWKKDWKYYGYTDNYKNIELNIFDENKIWQITDIEITWAIALKLFGKSI